MSILPVFGASFVGFFLVGLFLWNILYFFIFFICVIFLIFIFVGDGLKGMFHYESAFWLFVFSEVMVFGSFLLCCLIFDSWSYSNLSSSLEIPFIGCFVLLGSSITITAFHHLLGWKYCDFFLFLTILLGLFFVCLQVFEFCEIDVNIFDSSFYSSSFCTVGLHFSHVLLGVIGMVVMLCVGSSEFSIYHCTVLTWYWHFVDYVWLFVYTIVYVC
uniref:Cytochrome c oxidase subunit 3 n=1 Tax=Taenia martis TaxID=159981 RepID=L8AZ99_9CEST|nr:cytochrome c oxidase subunit III [Taenia martis]BAM76209.1 cytochrome c oxidase subunit 3 [Taenia martis]